LRAQVIGILESYLKDTAKSRHLRSDGQYVRPSKASSSRNGSNRNGHSFNVQNFFIDHAKELTARQLEGAKATAVAA
jgi:hypothetical protein